MSEESQEKLPAFNEAVKRYQQFLAEQGLSTDLLWVFREDVTSNKGRVVVRVPIPSENIRLAQALYEKGRKRDLGISLQVHCLLGNQPCCFIWLPNDEVDADFAMMVDWKLKMTVPVDPIKARGIKNERLWHAYLWWYENAGWNGLAEQVPRKNV